MLGLSLHLSDTHTHTDAHACTYTRTQLGTHAHLTLLPALYKLKSKDLLETVSDNHT